MLFLCNQIHKDPTLKGWCIRPFPMNPPSKTIGTYRTLSDTIRTQRDIEEGGVLGEGAT